MNRRLFGGFSWAQLGLAAMIAGVSVCGADEIVSWGGDYVTGNLNFTRSQSSESGDFNGDLATDHRKGLAFNLATPIVNESASYTGTNALFFGGATHTLFGTGSGANLDNARIHSSTPVDRINLRTVSSTFLGAFHAVVLWQKAGFLAGAGYKKAVTFDAASSIAVKMPSGNSPFTGRFVVTDGGVTYVSETTFDHNSGTKTLAPATAKWAVYSPTGLALNFDSASATFATHTFADIQAAGFHLEQDSIAAGSGNLIVYVSGFTLVAAVRDIPERGTRVLLCAASSGPG